jgi:PKD repeat protein
MLSSASIVAFVGAEIDSVDFPIESGGSSARVSKPLGSGPYNIKFITFNLLRSDYPPLPTRVYYPGNNDGSVDMSGAPYPGIVFAPGAGGTETSYSSVLTQIASWGYIVTIPGTGGGCNQEVVDTQIYLLDFYTKENQSNGGQFYGAIDTENFGASGHSNGGWTSIAGCVADDRFRAVSPLCAAASPYYDTGQANTANLDAPLQLLSGADDTTYLPSSDAYFSISKPISTYFKLTGSGHGGPFHLEYLISFFKYWLDGEKEYGTFIYGKNVFKDESDGLLEFDYKLGLFADPQASKSTVYEDEEFTLTGYGTITSPTAPNRYITNYEWDLDLDGEFDLNITSVTPLTSSYNNTGDYETLLRVTDSWGMMASATIEISVLNQKPSAVPGAAQTAKEDGIVYFDASGSSDTVSDIDTLKFKWDFGDGNVTSWTVEKTASHTYTLEANYTVVLFVMDDDSVVDSANTKVTVLNVPPMAVLSLLASDVGIGEPIKVNASMSSDTPSDNSSLSYSWEFGDSKFGEGISVEHSYNDEGEFIVTLTVTDDDGASDTDTVTITVLNSDPTCTAMDDVVLFEDESVTFTGSGSDTKNDEALLQLSWDLGIPGIPPTPWKDTANFKYTYTVAGVYTAVLSVRDDNGATATDTVEITVKNLKPTAKFLVSSRKVDEDEMVEFDASQSEDTPTDVSSLNFSWDFGDDTGEYFGIQQNHRYYEAGSYEVELLVEDDNGETDVFTKTIEVNDVEPTAVITATPTNTFIDIEILFSGSQSTDTPSDQNNLTYSWDFIDGGLATGETVVYSFADPGRYKVKLTVEDDSGQTDTIELDVIIKDYPAPEVKSTEDSEPEGMSDTVVAAIALNIVIIIVFVALLLIYLRKNKQDSKEP